MDTVQLDRKSELATHLEHPRPKPYFEKGKVYKRRDDIHLPFGGSHQSGITRSSKSDAVFIFTGESGEKHGYHDHEDDRGIYTYTGEGQHGEMQMKGGNLAIRDHAKEGRALHLFKSRGKGQGYEYKGEFFCGGHRWSLGRDTKNQERKIIIFDLVPVSINVQMEMSDDANIGTIGSPPTSINEARKLALDAVTPPENSEKLTLKIIYARSNKVKLYVLMRANGLCESCEKPAPFSKKNGTPYLEPHHINRLSDGGMDHPKYMGAICPSCHREIHYGQHGPQKNELLRRAIQMKESTL